MKERTTIGDRVRKARERSGLASSQAALAKRLRVTPKQVSVWENATNLEWRTLERIASALETTPEDIVNEGIAARFRTEFEELLESRKRSVTARWLDGIYPDPEGRKINLTENNLLIVLDADLLDWPPEESGGYSDRIAGVTRRYCSQVQKAAWSDARKAEMIETIVSIGTKHFAEARERGISLDAITAHLAADRKEETKQLRGLVSRMTEDKEMLDVVDWLSSDKRYVRLLKTLGNLPKDLSDADLGVIAQGLRGILRMIRQLGDTPEKRRHKRN